MNILRLERMNSAEVCYFYQPEGKGDLGEIVYRFSSETPAIVRVASQDVGTRYAVKAAAKVAEFVKKKNFPMEYTQAWY